MKNNSIVSNYNVKILEIYLEHNLNFKNHINNITNKL